MAGTQGKIFEVQFSMLLENAFRTLFLTAEAKLAHFLSVAAIIFFETLEFYGEFCKIEFF